jgi:NAD(P)-dependent dehydrogenase (short-subunit alcohol dehydrogenase family)
MMNISFVGKAVLVTGAGSGMGLATAKAFAEAGAAVALADINEAAVKDAADQLAKSGYRAIGIHCDVVNEEQVKKMVATTTAAFGSLDAAYNNAGVNSLVTDTADLIAEEWDRIIDVNLKGVWL